MVHEPLPKVDRHLYSFSFNASSRWSECENYQDGNQESKTLRGLRPTNSPGEESLM